MPGPEASPTARGTSAIVFLVLCVLLVAFVVAAVVLGMKWGDERAKEARQEAVVDAARAQALAFTTLDYEDPDASIDKVLDGSTGRFHTEYEKQAENLKELAVENESVSNGKILEAGLVSGDADSARVIVVADSTVANVNSPSPQPRHYRLQLDLVLEDGEWKTSDLQFVG